MKLTGKLNHDWIVLDVDTGQAVLMISSLDTDSRIATIYERDASGKLVERELALSYVRVDAQRRIVWLRIKTDPLAIHHAKVHRAIAKH